MTKTLVMKLGTQPFDVQEIYPAVHGGRVWIVGGLTRERRTRTESVSFAVADVLTANGTLALREEVALPEPRHHVGVASVDGSLYAIGGMLSGGFELSEACWVLRPGARAWAQIAPLPRARAAGVVMNVANSLMVASGQEANGKALPLSESTLCYDPQQDRWLELAGLAHPRDHAAGFVHEGKLYIVGGRRIALSSPVTQTEVYDPDTDKWSIVPGAQLSAARGGLSATKLGSRIYIVGGELPKSAFDRIDVLDLASMRWDAPRLLPASTQGPPGRHGHGAVALPDARLMLIGGADVPNYGSVPDVVVLDTGEQPR